MKGEEPFGPQEIASLSSRDRRRDEPRFSQDSQVLGESRLAEREVCHSNSGRSAGLLEGKVDGGGLLDRINAVEREHPQADGVSR